MFPDLKNKNVLITGAGRNIGRATALEFAQAGANVYFTESHSDRLGNLIEELKNPQYSTIKATGFHADITKLEDTKMMLDELNKKNISIDILVNNVGYDRDVVGLLNTNLDDWLKDYTINIFGPMNLTKRVVEEFMKPRKQGSIIFVTSIHQNTIRRHPIYSSSKAALGMIVKELAAEFAPHHIRVNGIAPGYTAVDDNNAPLPHKYTPLHQSSIPPEFIARNIMVLASDYISQYTTGTIHKIDAGLSLYNHLVDEIPLK